MSESYALQSWQNQYAVGMQPSTTGAVDAFEVTDADFDFLDQLDSEVDAELHWKDTHTGLDSTRHVDNVQFLGSHQQEPKSPVTGLVEHGVVECLPEPSLQQESFGFGSITGTDPLSSEPTAAADTPSLRPQYGRLRSIAAQSALHPSQV